MKKKYTLPAVTADWQATSVGVLIADDAKLRKWLSVLRSGRFVQNNFRFYWTSQPGTTVFPLLGSFCAYRKRDGIYVLVNLRLEDLYTNVEYPLAEFCSMLEYTRPSLGWCITVKVC